MADEYNSEYAKRYSQPKRSLGDPTAFEGGPEASQPGPAGPEEPMAYGGGGRPERQPNPQQNSQFGNYEAGRDAWMSGKYPRNEAGIQQWNADYGLLKNYKGGDTGNLANGGGSIDLISNFAGGRGNGQAMGSTWTPAGGNGPNPGGGGGVLGGGGPRPGPAGPGGIGGATTNMAGGPGGYNPYTPGQLPNAQLQAYTPGQLPQFQAPNQDPQNAIQNQALTAALQSGGSMNPNVVNAMKAQQQEQGTSMLQQQQQQIARNAALRGVAGGGVQGAQEQRAQEALQSALLGGYRDIDINAARTNFADQLAASEAMNSALGRQAGTASQFYGTGLQGQLAQQGLNQAGVGSQNEATRYNLQRALAEEQLKQSAAGMGEQSRQFGLGLGEQGRQFDIGQQLARAQLAQQGSQFGQSLGEQMRQYNLGYGLSAAELARQREQDYMKTLLGGR